MTTLLRALLIAALAAPLSVSAQNQPADPPKAGGMPKKAEGDPSRITAKKEKLTGAELQIAAHYYRDNLVEMDLGKTASTRGATAGVKSYGEMLVKDHGDFNRKLLARAKATGQKLPEQPATPAEKEMEAKMKQSADAVKKLSGAAFDREYIRLMVEHHHHTLANIDAHIAQAKDPELTAMLQEVKPVLQRHHDRARELQQQQPQAMK